MSKIDLNNISHTYNPNDPQPTYALNPFSMTWENGKRYAILGPSGCGKTTMLNIVSGLVRPSAGSILFDDKDVTDLKTENRNIAQVFQFPVIYNTMTVFENPKTLKVAEISNDPPMNILKANISFNKIKFEGIEVELPAHLSNLKDNNFNLGIRASDIELSEEGFEFEVELAEISGSETLLHLTRGDTKIITSIEEVMNFNIKDKIKINFNTNKIYAFNESGTLASSPFGGSYV